MAGKPKDSPAVENYLQVLDAMFQGTRGLTTDFDNMLDQDDEEGKRISTVLWSRMRNARLFELPMEVFATIYHVCDRYTTERFSGKHYDEPATKASAEAYLAGLVMNAKDVPFPEDLPFDHCYFAIEPALGWTEMQLALRIPPERLSRILAIWARHCAGHPSRHRLAGILIWHDGTAGHVVEMIRFEAFNDAGEPITGMVLPSWLRDENGWHHPYTMVPWITQLVIAYINQHKSIIVEHQPSTNMRYDFARVGKKMRLNRFPPKPYYVIPLKTKLEIQATAKKTLPSGRAGWKFHYRFDVRGHECVKIQRGPLPLEPKEEKKLVKRGYRIYTHSDLPVEEYQRLLERRVAPKRVDEWLAIKSWFRDSYQKPANPNLPYIPAVRKPTQLVEVGPDDIEEAS